MTDARIERLVQEATRLRYSRRGILKRASALGLSASAVAAAVLARTGTPASAAVARRAQPVTINWFAARDQTGYSPRQVEAFNAQNPNIQISYQEQGATTSDLRDKFVTIATAQDPSADLVSMDVPFVPEFAAAGWTRPVEEVLPAAEREAFFAGTIQGATYDAGEGGQLYAVPWFNNGPGLFYRKDLLDGAGLQPPKTYDELVTTATRLQTPEIGGFIWQGAQVETLVINFLEHLWGHGGEMMDAEGQIVLGEGTAAVDALQRLYDYVYTTKISPESVLTLATGGDAENVFASGRAVFLRQWMTGTTAMDAETSAVRGMWDVTTLPSATGEQPGPGALGTWNLGISAFSRYPEETAEAIRFLTSLDQQTARYLGNGSLPARPAVLENADVRAKYTYVDRLGANFEALKPRPVSPFYGTMSADVLQPTLAAAMTRQKEPAAAIEEMVAGLEQIVQM